MSEPGALCIGVRRSLCRDPALSGSLYRAPALSVSGPRSSLRRAPCSLCRARCRASPLSVSGPSTLPLCGPRRSLCPRPALSALCVGPRRARSVSGLRVGVRRFLALRRVAVLSASGPGTFCVGGGPGAFCVLSLAVSGPAPNTVCQARRSLCRAPALSVSGCCARPLSICVGVRRLGTLCVGARRSLPLSVSGPGALCVSAPSSLRAPAPIRTLRAPSSDIRSALALHATYPLPTNPRATHPGRKSTAPIRVWSAGPQLRSACHPSSPARSLFSRREPQALLFGGKC